jgi:hypothetical protein
MIERLINSYMPTLKAPVAVFCCAFCPILETK